MPSKPKARSAKQTPTKKVARPSPKKKAAAAPKAKAPPSAVPTRRHSDHLPGDAPMSVAPRSDLVFPAHRVRPPAPLLPPTDGLEFARSKIRDVSDFPKRGIVFKDITPLLSSPRAFHIVLDSIAERFIGEHVDAIVGVESRGFIFGGALAARLNASFVPARKPGKLPSERDSVSYDTEYSTAALEMHRDSLAEEARVIIVDDVLATGGTARAAAELVRRQGAYVVAYAFVVELSSLQGRERLLPIRVESVMTF